MSNQTSQILNVLIPVYNPGTMLVEVVLSLAELSTSTDLAIHIHVSDDCSPQFSAAALDGIDTGKASLTYHRTEKNVGETVNVNQAAQRLHEQGIEWFVLLHQDDLITRQLADHALCYIAAWKPGMPALVFGSHVSTNDVKSLEVQVASNQGIPSVETYTDIPAGRPGLDHVSSNWQWIPSGTLFHTESFLSMGGFYDKLRYAADNDFLVRWLMSGQSCRMVEKPFVLKRLHEASTTSRCYTNGVDNICWCYLLLNYSHLRTKRDNLRVFLTWITGNVFSAGSAIKRRNWPLLRSRIRGLFISSAGILCWPLPVLRFMLPQETRTLLRCAPIIVGNKGDACQ